MNGQNRKRNRLHNYDYSQIGYYFVTICTQNRQCLFGKIVEDDMILNEAGKIIDHWWNEIKNKFPNSELDEYVIMPNHLHGIVAIVGPPSNIHRRGRPTCLPTTTLNKSTKQGEPPGSPLQEMIQWFKTMATNEYIQKVRFGALPPFEKRIWQRSFYDHIIRNEKSLDTIRVYIQSNPLNWKWDENNPNKQATQPA